MMACKLLILNVGPLFTDIIWNHDAVFVVDLFIYLIAKLFFNALYLSYVFTMLTYQTIILGKTHLFPFH